MRLLNIHTKKLHTFHNNCPDYAVLSHTWLEDHFEVTYLLIQQPEACTHLAGWRKVEFACQQAIQDGYEWVWIDTCCIDKSSSAELSEAINSMFEWYRDSKVCYAYLSDIDILSETKKELVSSRWWTRSWTLQEFLIPSHLIFYDKNWVCLGTKSQHAQRIAASTGIDEVIIRNPLSLFSVSVAIRMSWAARREAKRLEDIAYALLGIFGINMPLLYGEGSKAFLRLQTEILKTSGDQSLFAWNFANTLIFDSAASASGINPISEISPSPGMFAHHPSQFKDCRFIDFHQTYSTEIRNFNGFLKMSMPLIKHDPSGDYLGLLPCTDVRQPEHLLGIYLELQGHMYSRQWIKSSRISPSSLCWGTCMVHVRDARRFEEREVLIEALGSAQPPPTLNYSILLDYSDVESKLVFLNALPYIWKVNDKKTTLTATRLDSSDIVVIAWFDERHADILCATISLNMVELFRKPAVPPVDIRKELKHAPVSEFSWNNAGFSKVPNKSRFETYLDVKRIFNNVIVSLRIESTRIPAERKYGSSHKRSLFPMTRKDSWRSD